MNALNKNMTENAHNKSTTMNALNKNMTENAPKTSAWQGVPKIRA
jgi:hypothetical protein